MSWLAKKFFWSMVFSCATMVVVQFIPGAKEKQKQALGILTTALQSQNASSQLEGSHEFRHISESKQNLAEKNTFEQGIDNIKAKINELSGAEPETVVINGKVYPRSPNNIYHIDGQRILYKPRVVTDTRKTASEEAPQPSESNTSLLMSPTEMMETMKKAQQNMKARNQALEELTN